MIMLFQYLSPRTRKRMRKLFSWFFRPDQLKEYSEYRDYDLVMKYIKKLEDRVSVLEEENISTTNALYEIANSLESRIDILVKELKDV